MEASLNPKETRVTVNHTHQLEDRLNSRRYLRRGVLEIILLSLYWESIRLSIAIALALYCTSRWDWNVTDHRPFLFIIERCHFRVVQKQNYLVILSFPLRGRGLVVDNLLWSCSFPDRQTTAPLTTPRNTAISPHTCAFSGLTTFSLKQRHSSTLSTTRP